jgi:hypothetical protein
VLIKGNKGSRSKKQKNKKLSIYLNKTKSNLEADGLKPVPAGQARHYFQSITYCYDWKKLEVRKTYNYQKKP